MTGGRRFSRILKILGPGLVTGAADDDPSGIATYSQAGAQFGFGTLWTMLLTFPLMVAVQDACMRIGAVTGEGLAAIVRQHYPKWVLYPIVFLVVDREVGHGEAVSGVGVDLEPVIDARLCEQSVELIGVG